MASNVFFCERSINFLPRCLEVCEYCKELEKENILKMKHKAKVLTKEEVKENRSNAYNYLKL